MTSKPLIITKNHAKTYSASKRFSPILRNLDFEIGELSPNAKETKNRYVNSVMGLMTNPGR